MKRFIRSSKYLDEDNKELLFDDTILVDIEIDLPDPVFSSSAKNIVKFPGINQFKEDIIDLLENEYGFEVIEDIYNGVKQKGHVTNRKGSESIYFDTYFDLSNSTKVLERLGVQQKASCAGTIYCFIHIRFSDHVLPDLGDIEHRNFINRNAEKYVKNNPKVTHVMREEDLTTSEILLQQYYDEAIDDLKEQLDSRIRYWVNKEKRYRRLGIS